MDQQNDAADEAHLRWASSPTRLDRALRDSFPDWGRSAVGDAISGRRVRVNNKIVWMSSWKVERGDHIVVHFPPSPKIYAASKFETSWIVADEGDFVVFDKPEGLRSERTRPGDESPNLLALAIEALGDDLVLAHRLDRDTSGLILATRPGEHRKIIAELFRTHTISKRYEAIVHAPPSGVRDNGSGRIENFMAPSDTHRDRMTVVSRGGKRAVTDYEVSADWGESQRVRLWPRTGRTHQLRVHCGHRATPILGDRLYGRPGDDTPRLLLHATELSFELNGMRTYESSVPF